MAEWLILRLPRTEDSGASWLLADGEGRPLSAVQTGSLAMAAAGAGGRRVAVLAPANQALYTSAELPQGGAARAPQVIAYALEEQLIADVESQHFAVGRIAAHAPTPVAVVARATMDAWLRELAAAALRPDLLVVDSTLLPRFSGYAVALLEGELLTISDAKGVTTTLSAPPGGFAAALEVALGEQSGTTALLFHATPLDWQRRGGEVEAVRPKVVSLKVQLLSSGVLPWLAAQLHSASPINLLQGEYAQRGTSAVHWQRWRLAAVLAGALLTVHVGVQAYRLWSLKRTERDLDASTAQLVAPALGALGPAGGGTLRARLERALSGAASAGDAAGLLPAMQVLAQAMGPVTGARLEALNFRDGALQLKVHAGDAQSLERIIQSLRAAGWSSELVSGGAAGDAYEGNIQVHGRNG
jgi:general secretion pathway protein L